MKTLALLAMVLGLATCETIQDVAFADGPASETATDDALDLARILVAEGGRLRTPDHAAILFTLARRSTLAPFRTRTFVEVARLYSVAFNGRATNPERAARMRALTRNEIPRHILTLVDAWLRGVKPADPCPGAWHWAAPYVASPLARVTCTGTTVNAFYARATR